MLRHQRRRMLDVLLCLGARSLVVCLMMLNCVIGLLPLAHSGARHAAEHIKVHTAPVLRNRIVPSSCVGLWGITWRMSFYDASAHSKDYNL